MKTAWLGWIFLLFITVVACDDDNDDNQRNNEARLNQVKSTAASGQWRVTKFIDSGADETSNFSGYIFEFDDNNLLTATNGSNNYPGTWSVTDDDNSNDDNPDDDFDDIDFNISFTSPQNFAELTEDWEILSLTNTTIELRHVSGGNGGTDLLTFERI